jgi:hypothetical protein
MQLLLILGPLPGPWSVWPKYSSFAKEHANKDTPGAVVKTEEPILHFQSLLATMTRGGQPSELGD